MTTFTITLPDERVKKLQELADRFRIAPEELVRASLEELLTRPPDDFQTVHKSKTGFLRSEVKRHYCSWNAFEIFFCLGKPVI